MTDSSNKPREFWIAQNGPHDFILESEPFGTHSSTYIHVVEHSALMEAQRSAEFWQKDSAAAWDKCEERRLEAVEAQAELAKAKKLISDNLDLHKETLGQLESAQAKIQELEKKLDEQQEHENKLLHEMLEQSRLLGISGSVELKLRAQLTEALEVIGYYADKFNWSGFSGGKVDNWISEDDCSMVQIVDGCGGEFSVAGKRARDFLARQALAHQNEGEGK